jgi:RNA polymerase sigma-54 factor
LDFNFDFNLVRSQKLLLIPQLKQAIEILEMNSRELFRYIENQLETNPALEEAGHSAEEAAEDQVRACFFEDDAMYENAGFDMNEPAAGMHSGEFSLKEHLLIRLESVCPDKLSYTIGEYLVDNTDDNGYLQVDTLEVAEHLEVPEEMVLKVLEKLQSLDPPGICARSLRECLLLQLSQMDEPDDEAIMVVDKFLEALASDDAESVAKATGMPMEKVKEIFKKVKSLEPRPGREFYINKMENPIIPDIFIKDNGNGLHVIFNEEAFPDIVISESFISGKSACGGSENGSFREQLNNAAWLIKCLEQRENIIFNIARKLCDCEEEFFRNGPKALKILDKSSFASSISIHESIFDRAVNGKHLQCRWGMFELSSFFGMGGGVAK